MKLEEVLPALRAGKIIKRKSWVSLELNKKLCDLLAEDWEIFGEECYQDGLKLPTEEYKTLRDNYVDSKLDELHIKMTVIHGLLMDVEHYTKNQIERINDIFKINSERLCDLEMKSKNMNEDKTAEKCPACNGLGFRTIFRDYPPVYSENIPCVPCDGRGVLWK